MSVAGVDRSRAGGMRDGPALPRLECDIVMAGGVTSGIVYPKAVGKLAERYVFRSIGGASVGAAMAAATAAAEYGRRTGSNPRAFVELAAIPDTLGRRDGQSRSLLLRLFHPEPDTGPLLALASPIFSGGGRLNVYLGLVSASLRTGAWPIWTALLAALAMDLLLIWGTWAGLAAFCLAIVVNLILLGAVVGAPTLRWLALGALLSVAIFVSGAWLTAVSLPTLALATIGVLAALILLLVSWAGAIVVMVVRVWLPAWRANGWGICTGNAEQPDDPDGALSLTPWMHRIVQKAAGRTESANPLTFGDLWDAPSSRPGQEDAASSTRREIELVMTTSDISRHRMAEIPFLESPTPLYVELEELARYFPQPIVAWMRAHPGPSLKAIDVPKGFIRLPRPEDLPIVFGARLSLSFPVLLCAFPLWTPNFAAVKHRKSASLRRVWFSDGGLSSNFPVHFFDAPLPSRPTFCFNLIDYDTEVPGGIEDGKIAQAARAAERSARAPTRNARGGDPAPGDEIWNFVTMTDRNLLPPVPFTDFDGSDGGVLAFFGTLVSTARFWNDNQLLRAPGIRERVVNVALKDGEGGLNLDMPQDVVDGLSARGAAAGLLIGARYSTSHDPDPKTGKRARRAFRNHRWVRYRSFMAAVEAMSRRFAGALPLSNEMARARGEPEIDEMIDGEGKRDLGYHVPARARSFFKRQTAAFETYALKMAAETAQDESQTFDRAPDPARGERSRRGSAPLPVLRFRARPMLGHDRFERAPPLPTTPAGEA